MISACAASRESPPHSTGFARAIALVGADHSYCACCGWYPHGAESRPTVQAHCSGVETNVCALRLACDTRREMGSRLMLSVRLEGSRLMLSVMTHAAHDSVLRWQRSQRIWLRHGESEPFRAHWQASLVTSSDFVGCERDFVGVNVTS